MYVVWCISRPQQNLITVGLGQPLYQLISKCVTCDTAYV